MLDIKKAIILFLLLEGQLMKKGIIILITILFIAVFIPTTVFGDQGGQDQIQIHWTKGPSVVDVGKDLAKLNLPKGYLFANGEDAQKIMKKLGNLISGAEVGIVYPEKGDWFILFEYDKIGYVKDNEKEDLDADELLKQLKDDNVEANKEREKLNYSPLELVGWDEKPHYDENTHNLVWSIIINSDDEKDINYNTRLLGRYGMTAVTLVADPNHINEIKPKLNMILDNFSYVDGKKYSDYVEGDKVSKFGLLALIAGGAGVTSKLGVFAKILLVFKKVWIILFVGIGAFYKKIKNFFKRDKDPYHNNSYLDQDE